MTSKFHYVGQWGAMSMQFRMKPCKHGDVVLPCSYAPLKGIVQHARVFIRANGRVEGRVAKAVECPTYCRRYVEEQFHGVY